MFFFNLERQRFLLIQRQNGQIMAGDDKKLVKIEKRKADRSKK